MAAFYFHQVFVLDSTTLHALDPGYTSSSYVGTGGDLFTYKL